MTVTHADPYYLTVIPIRDTLSKIEPYVPGKRVEGAVKLSSNENPLGMSPKARNAAEHALPAASIYPDGSATALRSALAAAHGLPAEQFIIGNGSDEIMMLGAATFLEAGMSTVMGAHTFSQYEFVTRVFGGVPRKIAMDDGAYPVAEIAGAVDENTRIVFLCNPNNPTGTSFSHAELESLLEAVPDDVLVIEDEAYHEYVDSPTYPRSLELLKRYDNLLVLRTFSKIYGMAGLRVGYGMGNPEMLRNIIRTKQPFNVGSVSQAAAAAALADTEFVARSQDLNRRGKEYLAAQLSRLGLAFLESEANFLCIEMNRDASAVASELTQLGVTIRPLGSFGLPTMIRATIGTQEQNELLVSSLERVVAESQAKHPHLATGEM